MPNHFWTGYNAKYIIKGPDDQQTLTETVVGIQLTYDGLVEASLEQRLPQQFVAVKLSSCPFDAVLA